jgi:hypothetical protein
VDKILLLAFPVSSDTILPGQEYASVWKTVNESKKQVVMLRKPERYASDHKLIEEISEYR